ncbi:MAG: flagellar export protein FliJ [Treponema sp.]
MKRFNFSLEKVLSLRIFYEKEAEIALSRAVSERDITKLKITDIDTKILEYSPIFSQDVDLSILLSAENYIKGLKIRKVELEKELISLEENVRMCIEKYTEKSKDRKIIERLKEKQLEEWKKAFNKEEIISIDEVISSKISM